MDSYGYVKNIKQIYARAKKNINYVSHTYAHVLMKLGILMRVG